MIKISALGFCAVYHSLSANVCADYRCWGVGPPDSAVSALADARTEPLKAG